MRVSGSRGPGRRATRATGPPVAGAADCAAAFMSLQDIHRMVEALAEAVRVLVPDGRLVIAVPTRPIRLESSRRSR
jgi:SAM-dependent methyltransferase